MSDQDKFNVTSHNQQGGITAGIVNVNQAPAPEITGQPIFSNVQENAEYHTQYEIEVKAPYPPSNLSVKVQAPSILRMQISPKRMGIVTIGHSGTRDGYAFTNIQSPLGIFRIDIFTSKIEKTFDIEWDVQ